jgi:hypothetical protein
MQRGQVLGFLGSVALVLCVLGLAGSGSTARLTAAERRLPSFTDVAAAMGTAAPGYGTAVAWGDYDEDGDLDLYVVNLGPGGGGQANALLRNHGATFTDAAAQAGVGNMGPGVAPRRATVITTVGSTSMSRSRVPTSSIATWPEPISPTYLWRQAWPATAGR